MRVDQGDTLQGKGAATKMVSGFEAAHQFSAWC